MMKKTVLYIYALLGVIGLSACSMQDEPFVAENEGAKVKITYKVSNASVTSRTEDGNSRLNENRVSRLDLFIVNENSIKHCSAQPDEINASSIKEMDISSLKVSDFSIGATVYLIANGFQNDATAEKLDRNELETSPTPSGFNFQEKQTTFVMDAVHVVSESDFNGNDLSITFGLERALSKIRFNFTSESKPSKYKFMHYAVSSTLLNQGESYENALESMNDYADITEKPPLHDDNPNCYIFYSYANDWFNEDLYKIETDPEKETYGKYVANEGIHNSEPIVEERQPYLLVQAEYDNVMGYYKIPVNYRLPNESDQPAFTKDELDEIRDTYYRLMRNHLYDITVRIDGPGGPITDPVTPNYTIKINDWENGHPDGGRYELPPGAFN